MEPANRDSPRKFGVKELFSTFRSSFKSRKGHRRDPEGFHNPCNPETTLKQELSTNSSSATGSNSSATGSATSSSVCMNSISTDLCASNQSTSERSIPEKKHLYTSQASVGKSQEEEYEEKSTVKEPHGYVGFANLPNQVYRRAVQRGFEFTLMVVGQSGLGKSTLVNSMFLADIYDPTTYPGPSLRYKKTVTVEETKVALKESGVNLTLTVVDTPGFGDAVNNTNSWSPISEYIDSKYAAYLRSEMGINRASIPDQRVHCCLYFIRPTGHGLGSLDLEFMKQLHEKVNIVPIIAKADTLTEEECRFFKNQIMREIAEHDVKIYEFPEVSLEDEEHEQNKTLKEMVPFAVVGSNTLVEVNGRKVRGRKYPWGVVDIENLEQCEFVALKKMVLSTHMQDLKDVTHFVHYENYRCRELSSSTNSLVNLGDDEKLRHELKIRKMKSDMQRFDVDVGERMQYLKNREANLMKKYETAKRNLEQQNRDLQEKLKQFTLEKESWESENPSTVGASLTGNVNRGQDALHGIRRKKKQYLTGMLGKST